MVVGENISEPVLRSVYRQIRSDARLSAANETKVFVFLAESKIRIRRHDTDVFYEVTNSYWSTKHAS
jgi:hypothetical protein